MQTSLSQGALAGLVATVPMTGSMLALRRFSGPQARALPPEHVADELREKMHLNEYLDGSEKAAFDWVSHFGFGAVTGAVYPWLVKEPTEYPLAKGMLFGLGLWAVSYSGWVPAAGLMPPPTRESRRYLFLEIASHLVWGACVGVLAPRLRSRS